MEYSLIMGKSVFKKRARRKQQDSVPSNNQRESVSEMNESAVRERARHYDALLYQLESVHGYCPLHALGPARPWLLKVTSIPTW